MNIPKRTGVAAGVTTGSPRGRLSRRRKVAFAGAALTGIASSMLVSNGVAQAALPALPDNLVIFPDRDFMTVEGFAGLAAGSQATVKVFRTDTAGARTQVGQTTADVSYPEDGVAFEVNHPGGACWGEGAPTGLDVTPDITGRDVVELEIGGQVYDMTVADISVAEESRSGNTVTVISNVPDDIPLERVEARIIQPDLNDTAVGRRDARATADGTGDDGYTSSLTRISTTQVRATYTFLDEATATTALAGTSRIMSWAASDGDERSGITISEHEEVGGPGMGGCPPGPGDAAQPGPGEASVVRSPSGDALTAQWVAAPPVAGGAAVSGYLVTATDPSGNLVGKKVGSTVTRADLTGLNPALQYVVEVRASTGTGADTTLSKPFVAPSASPTGPIEEQDGTPPSLEASQNATTGLVTVTTEAGAQIYYTYGDVSTNPVVLADMPSADALTYPDGGIPVTEDAQTTVNVAVFDAAGNKSTQTLTGLTVVAENPTPQVPGAPTGVTATPGQGSLAVSWAAPEQIGASAILRYQVTATAVAPATGTAGSATIVAPTTTATLNNLSAGVAYTVNVVAVNAQGESPAGTATATTQAVTTDRITIAGGRYRAGDRLEVNGTGTIPGAIISIRTGSLTGPVVAQATVAQPAAGATTGAWTVRIRAAVPTVPGSQVWATSDKTGTAGPVTLAR